MNLVSKLCVCAVFLVSASSTGAKPSRFQLAIQNDSRYDIFHLYMSTTEEENWGPDQLGDKVIRAGSKFTLTDIRVAEYDIKFVDEDRDECVLRNIIISQDTSWTITTDWLLKCEF